MSANDESLFVPRPFWFASTELLTNILRTEIDAVAQLFSNQVLRSLFDASEAPILPRSACFMLLAHRKIIEMIDGTLTERYENPPFLANEKKTLKDTHNLVPADAPIWVLEMQQVVEQLPVHIYNSLPELLRMGGSNAGNAEQVQSEKEKLSSVEQIRALTEKVLDQQLQRLLRRWSTGVPTFLTEQPSALWVANSARSLNS